MHALVPRIYPWPLLRMPFRIGYPRYQYEARDEDVKALHIRDRINRTHDTIHGEFHAQDSHLHKFHAQFRDNSHHHA